jgi:Double-stranded RNA binding motif
MRQPQQHATQPQPAQTRTEQTTQSHAYTRDSQASSSEESAQNAQPSTSVSRPFFCSVCYVQCTSQDDLNHHIAGRKHKNAEVLKAQATAKAQDHEESVVVARNAQDMLSFQLDHATTVLNLVFQHLFGRPPEFSFSESGLDHDKCFFASVSVPGLSLTVRGFGRNKKEAKKDASTKLCIELHTRNMLD